MSANNESDKKSVAARLVAMAQERYLLGVSEDGEPFGTDRARPHLAILLRAGKAGLRAELASRYFAETGTVAGGQALTDATLVLEGPVREFRRRRHSTDSGAARVPNSVNADAVAIRH